MTGFPSDVEISLPVFVREFSPLDSQLDPVSASLKEVDGDLESCQLMSIFPWPSLEWVELTSGLSMRAMLHSLT